MIFYVSIKVGGKDKRTDDRKGETDWKTKKKCWQTGSQPRTAIVKIIQKIEANGKW